MKLTDAASLKHCCQNILTAQWTRRLPFLQQQSPAELAADAIDDALRSIEDINTANWTIIDFCSGAGGPVPLMESLVNHARKEHNLKPIPFELSDIEPNLDAWMEHSSLSEHLSFLPNPVDASHPPFSVISSTTSGVQDAAFKQGYQSNGSKVFRLFCLSFHHFDDNTARKVLKSTLETSDAFAIIELQDRRIFSLVLMLLEPWLLLLVTILWFWHSIPILFFTYVMPILPAIHCFDGLVSCLRTRSFEETVRLIESVQGVQTSDHALKGSGIVVRSGDWVFTHSRQLHTWPIGYMDVIVGKKVRRSKEIGSVHSAQN